MVLLTGDCHVYGRFLGDNTLGVSGCVIREGPVASLRDVLTDVQCGHSQRRHDGDEDANGGENHLQHIKILSVKCCIAIL